MSNTLIVIIAARISEWVQKGETPPGYLNPNNGFSNIIVISLVPDKVDFTDIKRLCGQASIELRSIDLISWHGFVRTLFTPFLITRYINSNLRLKFGDEDRVSVRAYGDSFAGMVAAIIGRSYSCTSVSSIHTNHLAYPTRELRTVKHRILDFFEDRARRFTHKSIDYLAPVYSPALATISKKHHHKVHLIPNAVAVREEDIKSSYACGKELNLISVGRMINGKSVLPILEGLKTTPGHKLTIVGNGPLHTKIENWILRNNMSDRVQLVLRMENLELIQRLKSFDAFVTFTAYSEVPKTVIEAALVGLPIILNKPDRTPPNEYTDAPIIWVNGNSYSYSEAFTALSADENFRISIGQALKAHFSIAFDPKACDLKMYNLLTKDRI